MACYFRFDSRELRGQRLAALLLPLHLSFKGRMCLIQRLQAFATGFDLIFQQRNLTFSGEYTTGLLP